MKAATRIRINPLSGEKGMDQTSQDENESHLDELQRNHLQFPQNYLSPQLSQMIQQQQYSNPNSDITVPKTNFSNNLPFIDLAEPLMVSV